MAACSSFSNWRLRFLLSLAGLRIQPGVFLGHCLALFCQGLPNGLGLFRLPFDVLQIPGHLPGGLIHRSAGPPGHLFGHAETARYLNSGGGTRLTDHQVVGRPKGLLVKGNAGVLDPWLVGGIQLEPAVVGGGDYVRPEGTPGSDPRWLPPVPTPPPGQCRSPPRPAVPAPGNGTDPSCGSRWPRER